MLFLKLLFKNLFTFFTNKNYRSFLWFALSIGDKRAVKDKLIKVNGNQWEIVDGMSFVFQFKEIFFEDYYNFISSSTSPVILDCGANIGLSCLYFKHIYPGSTILAYEADPNIAGVLKRNLQRNNIKNIEVHAAAIWVHNDGIEMSLEGADSGSIRGSKNKTLVPSVRLKDILDKHSEIDLLKIDIEGAETAVIEDCGNSVSKANNIFIEYHSYLNSPQDLSKIIKILEDNGFRYFMNSSVNKKAPLVNKRYNNDGLIDFQINIFAYKK